MSGLVGGDRRIRLRVCTDSEPESEAEDVRERFDHPWKGLVRSRPIYILWYEEVLTCFGQGEYACEKATNAYE